ncbi:unnamed protein product [Linum trigynum]|uniref:CCHC-type domain-containing protein n=1 Tax=Linum trigynum TaxID=586398 RepID=A0AAV2GBJ4_9ROSI
MLSEISLSDKPPAQPFSQTGRPPDTGQQQPSSTPSPLANPAAFPILNYRAALAGHSQETKTRANQWTFVGEQDLVTGSFDGEPELKISEAFKERLCVPWKKTLVVRLLGRSVSYTYLCAQLRWKWRPTGSLDLLDLNNDTFLATFSNDQDYLNALTGGPWEILDHYLVVHQWSPTFRTSDKPHRSVVAWIQLPELPAHFYHREVLFALGNLLGRTVKLDYHTENLLRGKFARIAVELDMTKPLATRIRLDGQWQPVVYENLPHICYDCGRIGHTEEACPKKSTAMVPVSTGETQAHMIIPPAVPTPETHAGYGPWMQVVKKNRKVNKKGNSYPEELERNQNSNSAKSGNQGRRPHSKNPTHKAESKPRPNGQERKGKSAMVQDQKKESKAQQKGKVKEVGKISISEGPKDSTSLEWRAVGPLKDASGSTAQTTNQTVDKNALMGQITTGPRTDPEVDSGRQLPLIPGPTRLDKVNNENIDPNSEIISVRQHYSKKNRVHSPLKEHLSKLAQQNTMKTSLGNKNNKRSSTKNGKAANFGITPQSIEEFITQTRQKEEEFQKLTMGTSSDTPMR